MTKGIVIKSLGAVLGRALAIFSLGLFSLAGLSQTSKGQNQKPTLVALYQGQGTGNSSKKILTQLQTENNVEVKAVSAADIRNGDLKGFEVVIFGGGSGGGQGKALGIEGREKVREFVKNGGNYIGICAGAYLASADYDWSLHIINARVLDRAHWARGVGRVDLALNQQGQSLFQEKSKKTNIYYHQGPLLAKSDKKDLSEYQEWATFETEVSKKGVPGGIMPGKTAIASGTFGKGKVLAISPHPELTPGMEKVLPNAVKWATSMNSKPNS